MQITGTSLSDWDKAFGFGINAAAPPSADQPYL
jgi:hypothetical protein